MTNTHNTSIFPTAEGRWVAHCAGCDWRSASWQTKTEAAIAALSHEQAEDEAADKQGLEVAEGLADG